MSEKSLTESLWKSLATKQKLKDTTVAKALAGYAASPANEFAKRLQALTEIETAATTLRKTQKDNDDVEDYLIDILNGVRKERKTVEAEQKVHQKEDEGNESEGDEEPGGADPEAIKKKMLSLLGQVKAKPPTDPQLTFMALVAPGKSAVLLAKAAGASQKKVLLELVPNVSSPKFYTGECIWEENTHTFVLVKVPGGLAKKLSKALLNETGVKYKVRVRSFDKTYVADSDTEPESEENETEGEETTPTDSKDAFVKAFSAIKPDLDKVLAAKVAVSGDVQTLFTQIAGLARGQQFGPALAELPKLVNLIKTGLGQISGGSTTPVPPVTNPPPQSIPTEADFRDRLSTLVPAIKTAIAADSVAGEKLRARAGEANALAKQGNIQGALQILAELEQQLGGGAPKKPVPVLPGWNTAASTAFAQVESLRNHLRKTGDSQMVQIADGPLGGVADQLATSLRDTLDKFDQQAPGAKEALPGEIATFRTFLSSDLVGLLDANPFAVNVALRGTLESVLNSIEQAAA